MAKEVVKLENDPAEGSKNYSVEKIRKSLSENYACYVLITCKAPTPDGKMDVEMSYDGDEILAQYLLDNAQQVFDDRAQSEKLR